MTLSRNVRSATLTITLPERWIERSKISGLRFAHVPETGRGTPGRAAASRQDRSVKLSFSNASAGDSASYAIRDIGLPAGTYELPYSWREDGTAKRERHRQGGLLCPGPRRRRGVSALSRLADPGIEFNVTNDASTESETFVSMVPGDKNRYLVGANGGGGYNAWVTNNGGVYLHEGVDALDSRRPGEAAARVSRSVLRPDVRRRTPRETSGTGGSRLRTGRGISSRIVVNHIAAGLTTFQPQHRRADGSGRRERRTSR